jgi:hypothetical protein
LYFRSRKFSVIFFKSNHFLFYILINKFFLFRKSWAYLKNLKELFPFAPILLLTATCRLIDLQKITTKLGINYQQISLIRNISFENNQIIYEV